jgi:FtsP/CotA-like multicopper oxidase with cupredoxin domain
MVRIDIMANRIFRPSRRELLAGLGAAALGPAMPTMATAQPRPSLALHATIDTRILRPERPDRLLWSFEGQATELPGAGLKFAFSNELPVPVVLDWHGLDGVAAIEPLLSQAPVPAGESRILDVPFRQSGTYLCDLRLLGDGQGRQSRALAFTTKEKEAVAVDQDQIVLVEDWRSRPDGTAIASGSDAKDAAAFYTVNGVSLPDFTLRTNERLRLRFINACQRSVIAVKIENFNVRVMALDSQPAEPFQARNGVLLLAPGGRTDAFIDATAAAGNVSSILLHDGKEAQPIGRLTVSNEPPLRSAPLPPAPPLPSNGLPAQLDLKNALRFEVPLSGIRSDWLAPANLAATTSPAFHAKVGRTVVLALTNRADIATVFHLHGHHFRLLDRLDDGWKPYWLDTLAIEAGQTQRVAFAAEYAGRWLIETMATDWAAPRLLRWYSVE